MMARRRSRCIKPLQQRPVRLGVEAGARLFVAYRSIRTWRQLSHKDGYGSASRFGPECVKICLCAQVKIIPSQRGRRENALAELCLVEDLGLVATSLDHGELAG